MPRVPLLLCVAAALLCAAPRAGGAQIDISLNLLYDVPIDSASGGQWQVVAKSDELGVAALAFELRGARLATSASAAPAGVVNGGDAAGFDPSVRQFDAPVTTEFVTQQPLAAPGGGDVGVFYGVGTLQQGQPGDLGPAYATLTDVAHTPWATGDVLGEAEWDSAAVMFTGTFAPGDAPEFYLDELLPFGRVYTSLGTASASGAVSPVIDAVYVTRTNQRAPSADYNADGRVDALDYTVWRDTLGAQVTAGTGADGDFSGAIGPGDYDLWRAQMGLGGGGLAASGGSPAPSPGGGVLAVLCVALSLGFPRGICGFQPSSGIFVKKR